MRCLGRTRTLQRCKNPARVLVCWTHRFQPWVLALGVLGVLGTIVGLYQGLWKPLFPATGKLRGIVLANELGGPPVPNVQVAGVSAKATTTDDNGAFALKFRGKLPGEVVQITLSKAGHVVVNDVQLRSALPQHPDAKPLVLLLCKAEAREEMARRFYRLKSFEAIEVSYQKRLREIEQNHQTTATQLAKLRTERDQAKAAAEKAAEELARLRPGQSSELYQEPRVRRTEDSQEPMRSPLHLDVDQLDWTAFRIVCVGIGHNVSRL